MDLSVPFNDPLRQALQRELRAGERVLWSGRPLRRVAWSGFAIWLFAVPWTAFALFWTAMAFAGAQSFDAAGPLGYAFPLFGTPFIAIGFAMLALPFLPLFGAGRTLFAVTDQRLLRIFLGPRLWVKSVPADRLGQIERSERADGSGSIKIVVGSHIDSDGDRRIDRFAIGEVENAMLVESRVRQLAEQAGRRRISS